MSEEAQPRHFDQLPRAEQLDGVIWILGWLRWCLLRMTQRGIRHRAWYQRAATAEIAEVMRLEIVRSDPYVARILFSAQRSIDSAYGDARPRFALAAGDDIQRAMEILRERKAEA